MEEQIKYINRPVKHTIFQHNDFFHYMGHRIDWYQKHHDSEYDQHRVRYFIK